MISQPHDDDSTYLRKMLGRRVTRPDCTKCHDRRIDWLGLTLALEVLGKKKVNAALATAPAGATAADGPEFWVCMKCNTHGLVW